MRQILALFLSLIVAHAQAATVFPGPSGTVQTITSKGLLVGENWSTLDKDNYVQNSSAFKSATGVTASGTGATVARNTTTPLGEVADFSIDLGTTSSGYVEWNVRTLPSGLAGQQCTLVVQAATLSLGSATVVWQVLQSSNVVASVAMSASSVPVPVLLPVPCGSSANLAATKIRVAQTVYGSGSTLLKVAGVWYGDARKSGQFGSVAQATLFGRLTWPAQASCLWTQTGTSFANFPTDSDCTSPTAYGALTDSSSGDRPEFTATFPPGEYKVSVRGVIGGSRATAANVINYFRLFDGTSQVGAATGSRVDGATGTVGVQVPVYEFGFTQTSTASRTINLQTRTDGGGDSNIDVRLAGFEFEVHRFPSASELAVTPAQSEVVCAYNNSGTTSAGSTTSSGNVQTCDGALIGSINSTTVDSDTTFQVTLPRAPLSTEQVQLQFGRFGVWFDAESLAPRVLQGTSRYGARLEPLSSTLMEVRFGNQGFTPNNSIYAGSGVAWSGIGANFLWRVALIPRSSSTIYVQSPVRAAGTGTAPNENEVEYKTIVYRTSAFAQVSPVIGTYYDVTDLSLTLSPGVWDLATQCPLYAAWSSGGGYAITTLSLRTGSTVVNNAAGGVVGDNSISDKPPGVGLSSPIARARVAITSSTTYKTSMRLSTFSGTPAYSTLTAHATITGPATDCYLEAVRVGDR